MALCASVDAPAGSRAAAAFQPVSSSAQREHTATHVLPGLQTLYKHTSAAHSQTRQTGAHVLPKALHCTALHCCPRALFVSHLLHLAGQLVQLSIEGLSLRISLSTPAVLVVSRPWLLGATGRWWWKQVLSVVTIGVPCRATQDLSMSAVVVIPERHQDDKPRAMPIEMLSLPCRRLAAPSGWHEAIRVSAAPQKPVCQDPWLAITVKGTTCLFCGCLSAAKHDVSDLWATEATFATPGGGGGGRLRILSK